VFNFGPYGVALVAYFKSGPKIMAVELNERNRSVRAGRASQDLIDRVNSALKRR
jgi:hypothetical protein